MKATSKKQENVFKRMTKTQKIIGSAAISAAVVCGGIGIVGAILSSSNSSINNEIVINGYKYGNQLSNLSQNSMAYKDGWVYYPFATDHRGGQSPNKNKHGIFRVRLDGSENQQIVSGNDAQYISILGDWIYYVYGASELRRTKIDGSTTETLTSNIKNNGHINVVDDYVYYDLLGDGIYKIKIDGKGGAQKITSADASDDLVVANGWIYFYGGGKKGNGLGRIKIDGSGEQMLYNHEISGFAINGDYIYFYPVKIPGMKNEGHEGMNEDTYRIKIDGSELKKFIEGDRVIYSYDNILYSGDFGRAYTLDGKKVENYSSLKKGENELAPRAYYIDGQFIIKETVGSGSDMGVKIIRSDLDGKNTNIIFDSAQNKSNTEVSNVNDFLSRLDGVKLEDNGTTLTISKGQFKINYTNDREDVFKISDMLKIEQSEGGGYRFVVREEEQTSVTGYTMRTEEYFEILLDGTEATYCKDLGCSIFKRLK